MSSNTQPTIQTNRPLLDIDSLSVEYESDRGVVRALRDVSLTIREGEVLGIAGESGSGKSTLALAVLQYLGDNGRIVDGEITFDGKSIRDFSQTELAAVRGKEIAHVPQNPQRSLNPGLTVGEQIQETIRRHQDCSKAEAKRQALEMLDTVDIPDPARTFDQYPHQLSGGMQQRIIIGIALSCDPALLILDEPTTGLDVTTEAQILTLIEDLVGDDDTGVLLITHDIGVINEIADRLAILYAGEVMESGTIDDVLNRPAHPYTLGLLDAVPQIHGESVPKTIPGSLPELLNIPSGCIFADRCEYATDECLTDPIPVDTVDKSSEHISACLRWETVRKDAPDQTPARSTTSETETGETLFEVQNLRKHYDEPTFLDMFLNNSQPAKAVDDVSFDIKSGETVALVGESGCGKSTLGRTLLGLTPRTSGTIKYRGVDISTLKSDDNGAFHSECRIVFQDPESSLNPRKTVGESIERPLELFTTLDRGSRLERVRDILAEVGLGDEYTSRYPHELSGGEKQRVAIARAFVSNPSFVVLDEPVSALDVSIQASILELLSSLQETYETSYLLISHDLSVVNHISDRVLVMYLGKVVEAGTKSEVFNPPYHPYTRVLLSSVPSSDPDRRTDPITITGDVPSPRHPPTGCSFHPRCPQKIDGECESCEPVLETKDGGGKIACFHGVEELSNDIHD